MRHAIAMDEPYGREERKRHLRQLDAILAALEELNLQGETRVPAHLVGHLSRLGIDRPDALTVTELIDRVLAMQQPYLVKIQLERRRRRRRVEPEDSTPVPKAS